MKYNKAKEIIDFETKHGKGVIYSKDAVLPTPKKKYEDSKGYEGTVSDE